MLLKNAYQEMKKIVLNNMLAVFVNRDWSCFINTVIHFACLQVLGLQQQLFDHSSKKWNPSNSKSSSLPGGGKCARMQHTAQDGRTTRISLPSTPQHHRTSCRYAQCLSILCSGPSYALFPYCCLYANQVACKTHTSKQTVRKPGLSVIQLYRSVGRSRSKTSSFLSTIC